MLWVYGKMEHQQMPLITVISSPNVAINKHQTTTKVLLLGLLR